MGTASGGGSARRTDAGSAHSARAPAPGAQASLLASPWAALATPGGLCLCPLFILATDEAGHAQLEAALANARFGAASFIEAVDGGEAICLALGPEEAYLVPLPQGARSPSLTRLWRWFADVTRLCVTPAAKDLVRSLLLRGVDVRCALAEPKIAHWLLDPDDKQQHTVTELAAPFGLKLVSQLSSSSAPFGAMTPGRGGTSYHAGGVQLHGPGVAAISPAMRSRVIACWPEVFLSLPLMVTFLQRLQGQQLLESFWNIEMPTSALLAWMEHVGIGCDPRDPYHTRSGILYKLAALEERVRELVGRRVQMTSGEDVGRALFDDMQLAPPPGVHFRRKANGRAAYRSPKELLQRLPPQPVVEFVLEHRRLNGALRSMEAVAQAAAAPCAELPCSCCATAHVEATFLSSLPRVRPDLAQTATATGRLACAPGSLPLLMLENTFEVPQVYRPSLHEELQAGRVPDAGARVFLTVAGEPPPRRRQMREGVLRALETVSCADAYTAGEGECCLASLAAYWAAHGWSDYLGDGVAESIRQVTVQIGPTVLSYPADQVWRLSAPVRLANDTPPLLVSPRHLLVAEAGHVLLSVDYSQLEVRLMTHFSQDSHLVRILHGEGDVFRHIAAGWLRKAEAAVTAEERSGAKQICYGLVYGIGSGRLAAELGISRAQAQEFQTSFMREFPGIDKWIGVVRERARRCGFVETLQGRRRFLPALAAKARDARMHAERQAVNTVCQASAADLMKVAMLSVHQRLRQMHSHDNGCCRPAARLMLQIHDELLLEVRADRLEDVRAMVVTEMIGAGNELLVPLQVKWRTGASWGSLE